VNVVIRPATTMTLAFRAILSGRGWVRWAATAGWLLAAANVVISLLLWGSRGFPELPLVFARGPLGIASLSVLALVFATVGAILASRVQGNAIGWLLLSMGVVVSVLPTVNLRVAEALGVLRPAPSGTVIGAWLASSLAAPLVAGLLILVLLLFPTGHPPSRRWWVAGAVGVGGSLLVALAVALDPRGILWYPALPNPLAPPAALAPFVDALRLVGLGLVLAGLLLGAGSLLVRYRCADCDLQRRLRVVVVAGLVSALTFAPFLANLYGLDGTADGEVLMTIAIGGAALLAVAVAVGVTRYRLLGAEAIIGRSLVYLPLLALSGGLFVASIALFQRLFISVTGNTSDAAVVIATLVVGATFTTVRRAIDGFAERRFKPRPVGHDRTPAAAHGGVDTGAALGAVLDRLERAEARLAELEASSERGRRDGEALVRLPVRSVACGPSVARPRGDRRGRGKPSPTSSG
jgi:hypothetical protein